MATPSTMKDGGPLLFSLLNNGEYCARVNDVVCFENEEEEIDCRIPDASSSVQLMNTNTYDASQPDSMFIIYTSDPTVRTESSLNSTTQTIPNTNFDKPHQCPDCPLTFAHRYRLDRHKIVHSDEKPYECKMCNHKTKRKRDLALHYERVHSGIRDLPKKQTSPTLVNSSDDRPFKCPECDHSCKSKSNLNEHLVIHSDERPFHCPDCSHKSKRKRDLTTHLKTHLKSKVKPQETT